MNQLSELSKVRAAIEPILPKHRDLYYGGKWQKPQGGYLHTWNPATGESLGPCAEANAVDVDVAVRAANAAFKEWRRTKPLERAALMKKVAAVSRANADEVAMLDAGPTAATRSARCAGTPRQPAAPLPLYTLGAAREEYERIWIAEVSQAMIDILFRLPQPMRYETRGRLWRAMEKRRADGQPCNVAALEAQWVEQRQRMEKSVLRTEAHAEPEAA
jgi:hypothetical protein